MTPPAPRRHRFAVSVPRAKEIQLALRDRVVETPGPGPFRFVAGADISFNPRSPTLYAAVVVIDTESGAVVERVGAKAKARFPYVPGYLSFREIPALLPLFDRLRTPVDLLVTDGHGRAHPRRFGLACHLGVLLDLPTVGCAKSRLVGEYSEPRERRGAYRALRHEGEVIGCVLRTRAGVRPVFVSVGHRVDLATARRAVLRLAPRYRLPEPTREAHAEVNRRRRKDAGPTSSTNPVGNQRRPAEAIR